MHNILWIQTESGSSLWENGQVGSSDSMKKLVVSDNVSYHKIDVTPFQIYHNKYKHETIINGHVCELDSTNRRIPFAFYLDSDNIFFIVDVLKKNVKEKGFSISESECNVVLNTFVDQSVIPFLSKQKLKKIITRFAVSIASLSVFFIILCLIINKK